MDVKSLMGNKWVWLSAGGVGLVAAFLFIKGRSTHDAAPSDAGSPSDFAYYSMPLNGGVATTNSDTLNSITTSQMLDLAKSQSKDTANQTYAGIGASFFEAMNDMFMTNKSTKAGAVGTINIGGTPISFDFTYKDPKAVIMPVTSNTTTPKVVR